MNFYEKHLARQEDLQIIHTLALEDTPKNGVEDNLKCVMRIYLKDDAGTDYLSELSVLRRGYKIQWTAQTKMYELFNTQCTDYYKYVKDTIIDRFLKDGFVRTCDELQIARDRKRIEYLNKKIGKANSERNDSLMIHWRQRRIDLIENINKIEATL